MTDETHITILAEEETDGYNCPVCGTPFDVDEWPLESHMGDAWGGSAQHSCPTDDCDGTITVIY